MHTNDIQKKLMQEVTVKPTGPATEIVRPSVFSDLGAPRRFGPFFASSSKTYL